MKEDFIPSIPNLLDIIMKFPLLETRQLSKSFGQRKVINNLSLKVMRGDVYGFIGRNGQGKTTAIRLITGLIFPDAGEVIIDGCPLRTDF